jgi:NADH dehydrogenase (ubiquinone) Fe-S protein 3
MNELNININKKIKILEYVVYLNQNLIKYIKKIEILKSKKSINLILKDAKFLEPTIFFLKKHSKNQFELLSDIFSIDLLSNMNFYRFQVLYSLLSLRFNIRINLIINVHEYQKINSIFYIFKNASWFEREIWDMFGIFFFNHNDLRRILSDYGFEGFPLRKDFPLSGFFEIRYDDKKKRIVYEVIETSQEFRLFEFKSPWESSLNIY